MGDGALVGGDREARAVREGVLRRDTKREDGSFRDTVVLSILSAEWPAVNAGLEARLRG